MFGIQNRLWWQVFLFEELILSCYCTVSFFPICPVLRSRNIFICKCIFLSLFILTGSVRQLRFIRKRVFDAAKTMRCFFIRLLIPRSCNINIITSSYPLNIQAVTLLSPPKIIDPLRIHSFCCNLKKSGHLHSIRNHIFENQILIRIKYCFLRINDNGPCICIIRLIMHDILRHRPFWWNITFLIFRFSSWFSVYTYFCLIAEPVFLTTTRKIHRADCPNTFNRDILRKCWEVNFVLHSIYCIICVLRK